MRGPSRTYVTWSYWMWWSQGRVKLHNALIPQVSNKVNENWEDIGRHLSNLGHHVVDPGIPRLIPRRVSVLQCWMLVDVHLRHKEWVAGVQTCTVIASMKAIEYVLQTGSLERDGAWRTTMLVSNETPQKASIVINDIFQLPSGNNVAKNPIDLSTTFVPSNEVHSANNATPKHSSQQTTVPAIATLRWSFGHTTRVRHP